MKIQPKDWKSFSAELLALYEPPLRAKNTRSAMKHALDQLEALGVASTADLDVALIGRLVASRPPEHSARTTLGLLRRLRSVCNYAVNCGYLRLSPFQARPVGAWLRLGRPKVKPFHTREEIRRVLELMRHDVEVKEGWARWRAARLYALATLVSHTGIRRNEALFAWVEDIDLDARVFRVQARHRLKTEAAAQPVPIPLAVVPVFRDLWLPHRLDRPPGFALPAEVPWLFPNVSGTNCWTDGSVGTRPLDRLRAVGDRAGVGGFSFHSMRRSLATALESAGVPQILITRCLRHTSEATTRTWYQGTDLPALAAAVADFEF